MVNIYIQGDSVKKKVLGIFKVKNLLKLKELIMSTKLFDQTLNFIQRALDILSVRHKIISTNISNLDSSNYIGKEIPFKKILNDSLSNSSLFSFTKTHPSHIDLSSEKIITILPKDSILTIDQEMAKLAENQLMFQAGVQVLLKKLEALRFTIQEGGK